MDASKLQFPNEAFNLVNCVTVLQHIFDDQKWKFAIHEMTRVTKPRGHILLYETAPLFTPRKSTRYLRIRKMGEYISEFKKVGAHLVYWRGTDLSLPLTIFSLKKYASSFNEEEVYYYWTKRENFMSRAHILSSISKIVATLAKPIDYNLAKTSLGMLSIEKILLFQKKGMHAH